MRWTEGSASKNRIACQEDRKTGADPGEKITVKGIKGLRLHQANGSCHRFLGENPALLDDFTLGIDEAADPRIGCPGHEDPILDGPESGDGKVLVGGGGPSEPGIISDRDQKVGPFLHKSSAEVRKDDLKADENPKSGPRHGKVDHLLAGLEISNAFSQ